MLRCPLKPITALRPANVRSADSVLYSVNRAGLQILRTSWELHAILVRLRHVYLSSPIIYCLLTSSRLSGTITYFCYLLQ